MSGIANSQDNNFPILATVNGKSCRVRVDRDEGKNLCRPLHKMHIFSNYALNTLARFIRKRADATVRTRPSSFWWAELMPYRSWPQSCTYTHIHTHTHTCAHMRTHAHDPRLVSQLPSHIRIQFVCRYAVRCKMLTALSSRTIFAVSKPWCV